MARGRLISLWRRWSQLTAGLSTAARKRATTNQPTNVRTCQIRNSAPSTTTAVSKATATVRTTCEGEAPTHPASWRGMGAMPPCVSFSSFIPLAPTELYSEALQPRRVGQQAKASCAGLLPSRHLIGSHPPLRTTGRRRPHAGRQLDRFSLLRRVGGHPIDPPGVRGRERGSSDPVQEHAEKNRQCHNRLDLIAPTEHRCLLNHDQTQNYRGEPPRAEPAHEQHRDASQT